MLEPAMEIGVGRCDSWIWALQNLPAMMECWQARPGPTRPGPARPGQAGNHIAGLISTLTAEKLMSSALQTTYAVLFMFIVWVYVLWITFLFDSNYWASATRMFTLKTVFKRHQKNTCCTRRMRNACRKSTKMASASKILIYAAW